MGRRYLLVCQECTFITQILEMTVYRIDTVLSIPLDNNNKTNQTVQTQLQNLKKLLTYGFYFAVGGDLTLTRQHLKAQQSDEQFIWNSQLLQELAIQQISQQWRQPIIQGFVSNFQALLSEQNVEVTLISRRSRIQGGTRYFSRGIEDSGHVANYVETEMIIIVEIYLCSYICVRGSVPLFWSQESSNSGIKLNRSQDLTQFALNSHFETLRRKFQKVRCVDLMSSSKQQEKELSEAFRVQVASQKDVVYEHIDFHNICNPNSYEGINPYVHNLSGTLNEQSFYLEKLLNRKPIKFQNGVYRINCVDCLDRTNAFQTKLMFLVAEIMLDQLGEQIPKSNFADQLLLLDETNKKSLHDFVIKYKNLWADNGDQISYIYAGTASTTSDMTRDGKQGVFGLLGHGVKTLGRFYNSTFEDNTKQQAINNLLLPQDSIDGTLEAFMKRTEKHYSTYQQMQILVVSWNVSGRQVSGTRNFKDGERNLFSLNGQQPPDILVVGLQEVVDLNAQNILLDSDKERQIWEKDIELNLVDFGEYIKITSQNLVGIYGGIWIRKHYVSRVSKVDTEIVKCGLGGTLGNKGAVCIILSIDDTQLSFIICHLTSGNKEINERLRDITDIHEKAFQSKRKRFINSDYRFMLGDMNFRINLPYSNAISMINKYNEYLQAQDLANASEIFSYLFQQDQLQKCRHTNPYLQQYQEQQITFLPTYKFGINNKKIKDFNSEIYDTSKKQRTPSWCDRIMICNDKDANFTQQFYQRRECTESDHRPVAAYYSIVIKKIDKSRYNEVLSDYYSLLRNNPRPDYTSYQYKVKHPGLNIPQGQVHQQDIRINVEPPKQHHLQNHQIPIFQKDVESNYTSKVQYNRSPQPTNVINRSPQPRLTERPVSAQPRQQNLVRPHPPGFLAALNDSSDVENRHFRQQIQFHQIQSKKGSVLQL